MTDAYEGPAIIELMGHRRLAGFVSQAEQYGTAMLRIDIPGPDGDITATQYVGGGSIYCLTPTTEDMVRAVAARNQPEPVHQWELPRSKVEEAEPADVIDEDTHCIECGTKLNMAGYCPECSPL